MSKFKLRIMLIEDNPFDFELIQEHLRSEFDCEVVEVTSHVMLLDALDRALPDVVISDSNVPRFNGMVALDYMQSVHPQIPFIFCSGNGSPTLPDLALSRGAKAWVSKDDLSRLVREIKSFCGLTA
jgi:CheY-like chemotaxis protein